MMCRRATLLFALGILITSSVEAQQAAKVLRVGVLAGSESFLLLPVARHP